MSKSAVLLLNLGSPDSTSVPDVIPPSRMVSPLFRDNSVTGEKGTIPPSGPP